MRKISYILALAAALTVSASPVVYAQGDAAPSSEGLTPNGDMKAADKQKGGGMMKKKHHSKKHSKMKSGGM